MWNLRERNRLGHVSRYAVTVAGGWHKAMGGGEWEREAHLEVIVASLYVTDKSGRVWKEKTDVKDDTWLWV